MSSCPKCPCSNIWITIHGIEGFLGRATPPPFEFEIGNTIRDCWKQSSRGVAKSRAKHETLIQNECENRRDAKQSLQEEPFSAQSAKTIIFAQHKTEIPPQSDGLEAILGMENSSCTWRWQNSAFKHVLPALAGSTFSQHLQFVEESSCQEASKTEKNQQR